MEERDEGASKRDSMCARTNTCTLWTACVCSISMPINFDGVNLTSVTYGAYWRWREEENAFAE